MSVSRTQRWSAAPYRYAEARALSAALGVSPTLATVLTRRGLCEPEAARRFLDATEVHDPARFEGIGDAAALVLEHVRRGGTIAVHGDYDVDGVCSTAVLVRTLRGLGAAVRPRIPSRTDDGYGLSAATVQDLHSRGDSLLITADCGIGAVDEVATARSLGMDVIVTDHHRPGERLPDCPVVHPAVCGYPADLCATGVAYKLAQAIYTAAGRDPAGIEDELDIVALATVADLVPLQGENRTLVRHGLRTLAGTSRPGLRALMRVARVDPQSVDERTLGFALAPRINAAGRLYRADAGLELMLTEDADRALEIARELDAINTERQSVETATVFEAERLLSDSPERRGDTALVLASAGWHPGVIGIVASRLVERYHRPCVLIALDGEGGGRGSGRSISAYDLHAGLGAAAEHLIRFGGHRMAAGLEVEERLVEPFRRALLAHATATLDPLDLVPSERVDAVVPGSALGLELAEELERLRPFGMGNPGVNLLVPATRVSDVRPMGEGRHARFTIASGGARAKAVAFGVGQSLAAEVRQHAGEEARHDVVARLERNQWQGAVEPRLVLRSIHSLRGGEERTAACPGSCADCSCRPQGEEWLDAVWAERDRLRAGALPDAGSVPAREGATRAERILVDRRHEGGLGSLADLLTTSDPVLVACADVSRRRVLFERALHPGRFGRPGALYASAHCRAGAVERRLAGLPARSLCVAEYAVIEAQPDLAERFSHVFLLDPPPSRGLEAVLRRSIPPAGDGAGPAAPPAAGAWFLHLGWGPAELDFARAALAHEHTLRPALATLYRQLSAASGGLAGTALERTLAGDGRHPRMVSHAARCLMVLEELRLAEVDSSSATVRCTMTGNERVDLDRSATYTGCAGKRDEGLSFLATLTETKGRRIAA